MGNGGGGGRADEVERWRGEWDNVRPDRVDVIVLFPGPETLQYNTPKEGGEASAEV